MHLRLFEEDFLDAERLATDSERHDSDQFLCHIGNRTETIRQAFAIGIKGAFQVAAASQVIKFTIEQHTLRVARNISVGEKHLDIRLQGTVVNPLNIEH